MSGIAIEGLISGFDTTEIVNAILDSQYRMPINDLEKRIETEVREITAFQTLSANLLGLGVAADTLSGTAAFEGKEAVSSNTSVVTATASTSAQVGNFSIQVSNLAQAEQISTDFFSSATDALSLSGEFVINGRAISVDSDDSLTDLANSINFAGTGVTANVVQTAASQHKLVLSSNSTGVSGIDLRDAGSGNLLQSLTLTNTTETFKHTVQANATGAISNEYANSAIVPGIAGTFKITDASGQYEISVTLAGTEDIDGIAAAITTAAAGTNISASVIGAGPVRLQISGSSGIPTKFEDTNGILADLGVVAGKQSEAFASSVLEVDKLLHLDNPASGTITIDDGEGQSINVTIDLATDSLTDIKDAIEAAVAVAGPGTDIAATVLDENGQYRLEITGATGFSPVLTDDNNVLETLGFIESGFNNLDQSGENSEFLYNGVTVNRTTNVVADLVTGVSFGLLAESAAAVNIRIDSNVGDVASLVEDFTEAFNTVMTFLEEQTFYDASDGEKGLLFGDSAVRGIKNKLASMLSMVVPDLPNVKLSELNGGLGVDGGSIKVTDRAGKSVEIDLTTARTVQDVINLININESVDVKAAISDNGRGIVLNDLTGSSLSALQVEEVGSGQTAEDLGILRSTRSTTLYSGELYEGGSSTISEFGISLELSGQLTFDALSFENKLATDPDAIRTLFTAQDLGFAKRFANEVREMTFPNTGIIDSRTKAANDNIEDFQASIDRFTKRSERMEAVLRRKFTALEITMAQSQNTSQYLSQQLSA